jgi:ABC-2 type transport system ATP-binding protein
VFALLGPNGAGKTTTVQILSTLIPADGGQVRVLGHDVLAEPEAIRTGIGVTRQFSAVDDVLTGAENLAPMGYLHHRQAGLDAARRYPARRHRPRLPYSAPAPLR